jgi:cytoskeletal protein RodZ
MNDFGGRLRQARERRGVSLRQIAASTKISVTALEALERNDVSRLPGGIFSRAFVRSYAIEVGLDPEQTVREFLERFQGEPAATAPAAAPARVTEDESSFESQQRMASVLLKLVIVSLPLVGVILYFTLRQRPAPEAQLQGRAPRAQEQVTATTAQAGSEPAATARMPATDAPAAVRAGPMRLELHPAGACWIMLKIDGRDVLSRVMQAGEREAYEVREAADITVGDAGAFAFSINGRAGRPLGQMGQVRTVRITRENLSEYIQ